MFSITGDNMSRSLVRKSPVTSDLLCRCWGWVGALCLLWFHIKSALQSVIVMIYLGWWHDLNVIRWTLMWPLMCGKPVWCDCTCVCVSVCGLLRVATETSQGRVLCDPSHQHIHACRPDRWSEAETYTVTNTHDTSEVSVTKQDFKMIIWILHVGTIFIY